MSSLNLCVIFGFLQAITKKIAATEDCKIDSTIDCMGFHIKITTAELDFSSNLGRDSRGQYAKWSPRI